MFISTLDWQKGRSGWKMIRPMLLDCFSQYLLVLVEARVTVKVTEFNQPFTRFFNVFRLSALADSPGQRSQKVNYSFFLEVRRRMHHF